MANKPKQPTKRIWSPEIFEVNIGGGTYILEPQPIERIIEFDNVAKSLAQNFTDISPTYYVTNGTGNDVEGPFEEEGQAEDYIARQYPDLGDKERSQFFSDNPDKRLDVRVEDVSMRQVLESLVSAPHPALQVLIPELTEEDVKKSPLPNLKHVFDILIEINGVAWFEKFVKNSLAPIQADILNLAAQGIKGALTDTTGTKNETDGETA